MFGGVIFEWILRIVWELSIEALSFALFPKTINKMNIHPGDGIYIPLIKINHRVFAWLILSERGMGRKEEGLRSFTALLWSWESREESQLDFHPLLFRSTRFVPYYLTGEFLLITDSLIIITSGNEATLSLLLLSL